MDTELQATNQNQDMMTAMRTSLYPGASDASIKMVLAYCSASGLDPMLKPVHIVPMWDAKSGGMRDVVMPGIGLYRTIAARSGQLAGISAPEFGPIVTSRLGSVDVEYPCWCSVTVRRQLATGVVAEFTAVEYWIENYAIKGGKERDHGPNAMWAKRPRGQIAKCAQAQALRMAFPEVGAQPTADEMEGKTIDAAAERIPPSELYAVRSKSSVSAPALIDCDVVDEAISAQPTADESTHADPFGPDLTAGMIRQLTAKSERAGIAAQDVADAVGGQVTIANLNRALAWIASKSAS